ncbi:MAG: hypothetical protein KAU89_09080 [Candidatus Thorarchaeota archaeon]|nr:hypothetical protein [Candidatus Thorarchaeota archaeon]
MFRTVIAILVALCAAIIIGAFQIVGLSLAEIQLIADSGDIILTLKVHGAALFQGLMRPYTVARDEMAYAPIVALGVAGFISGLISKDWKRMIVVSLVCVVLFFAGFAILVQGVEYTLEAISASAVDLGIDFGVALALLGIPGIIGASLTKEEY